MLKLPKMTMGRFMGAQQKFESRKHFWDFSRSQMAADMTKQIILLKVRVCRLISAEDRAVTAQAH